MGHMKRNFYNKRSISRRGMYLDIDMRKHHSRECHTFWHAHIHPLNTVIFLCYHSKQNALPLYTVC